MLEKKLIELKDYWCSIERYEGKYCLSAEFPEEWTAYSPNDKNIEVIFDEKTDKYWYVAKSEKVTLKSLVDFLWETVQTNIEAAKKAVLYNQKVEELKQFFNDNRNSLKDLENLSFDLTKNRSSKSNKTIQPKKSKPNVTDIAENINEKKTSENVEVKEEKVANFNDFTTPSDNDTVNGVDLNELRGDLES